MNSKQKTSTWELFEKAQEKLDEAARVFENDTYAAFRSINSKDFENPSLYFGEGKLTIFMRLKDSDYDDYGKTVTYSELIENICDGSDFRDGKFLNAEEKKEYFGEIITGIRKFADELEKKTLGTSTLTPITP